MTESDGHEVGLRVPILYRRLREVKRGFETLGVFRLLDTRSCFSGASGKCFGCRRAREREEERPLMRRRRPQDVLQEVQIMRSVLGIVNLKRTECVSRKSYLVLDTVVTVQTLSR